MNTTNATNTTSAPTRRDTNQLPLLAVPLADSPTFPRRHRLDEATRMRGLANVAELRRRLVNRGSRTEDAA